MGNLRTRLWSQKNRDMKKIICSTVAVCMLFVGLPASVSAADTYQETLEEINGSHREIDAPSVDLNQYRYDFNNGKPMLTDKDIVLFTNTVSPKKTLDKAAARKEIDYLFRLFRTQYGLYTWFGGDEVFGKAEKNLLELLDGEGTVPIHTYQDYLVKNLSFIEDSHFIIGDHQFKPQVQLFSSETSQFYKSSGQAGFFMDGAETMPVLSVNGEPPESYIKRAIGLDGGLTYCLYAMAPLGQRLELSVAYLDHGAEKEKTYTLLPAQFMGQYHNENPTVVFHMDRGFPYIQVNDMGFGWGSPEGKADADIFLQFAEHCKKSSIAVMDLTNNPGGDIQYAHTWFQAYTGALLQPNYAVQRIKPGPVWSQLLFVSQEEKKWYDDIMLEMGLTGEGNYYVSRPEKQFEENNGATLFVLTSRYTASAAEAMTDAVRNIENAVIIGTNTSGVLINDANYGLGLPYSGLYMQFGEDFRYWNPDDFQEGYGLEPDIYLTGSHTAERFEKFLARYQQAQ